MQQVRGKSVAEIAYKFSFVEHQRTSSLSNHAQREDALSAATSARLAEASYHGQVEDGLVQRTRLGSNTVSPPSPSAQVFVPPPPPTAPAFIPPPPPPPPPVMPPPQALVLRGRSVKKGEKKKRDSEPQLSMAEVVAKAKKMREARENVLSTGSSASANQESQEDPFESAMQARVVQLKSRRVEVQQGPRQEEDNEMMREMRRKAKRASQAFVEKEEKEGVTITIVNGGLSAVNGGRVVLSSSSSRGTGDSDSIQSSEGSDKLESPKEVNDFVNSLFDPVLSQGVEGLSSEIALQGALKGGGGVNQPTTTSVNTSASGTFTTTAAVNGHPVGQGNGYPAFPMQGNGYPGLIPGMVPAGMYYGLPQTNGPMFPAPSMDAAVLAAQQQILIERLIAQQALLQQQQTAATQKQQEQLLQLAQQQQAQLEQMQQLLAATGQQSQLAAAGLNQSNVTTGINTASAAQSTSVAISSIPVNGHAASENGENDDTKFQIPLPPPEFSDTVSLESAELSIPSSPPPPYPMSEVQEQSITVTETFPPPPTPLTENADTADNVDAPPRPELKRRSTDKVALAVAALELISDEVRSPGPMSPVKPGEQTFSFTMETSAKERPEFHKRASSSMGFVLLSDKQNKTVLHPRCTGPYLSYNNVKWRFNIRKEVGCNSCTISPLCTTCLQVRCKRHNGFSLNESAAAQSFG